MMIIRKHSSSSSFVRSFYQRPSRRRRLSSLFVWFPCLLFAFLLNPSFSQFDGESSLECVVPHSQEQEYEWEHWNYYKMLGLEQYDDSLLLKKTRHQKKTKRSKIVSADIRKAYRKQAQLYHPDKLAAKHKKKRLKQQQQNSTKSSSKEQHQQQQQQDSEEETLISVEESTARFAKIAQAYEVLYKDETRIQYDDFLLDCEDYLKHQHPHPQTNSRSSTETDSSSSTFFQKFQTDPWRVFDDFFFGDSGDTSRSSSGHSTRNSRQQHSQNRQHQSHPRRVYEQEEFLYDPYQRVEVLRMLRTEEYELVEQQQPQQHNGEYYYRVVGQDFVEQYDPMTRSWNFQPISAEFIVEEGYGYDEPPQQQRQQQQQQRPNRGGQQQQQQKQQQQQDNRDKNGRSSSNNNHHTNPSMLVSGEYLTMSLSPHDVQDKLVSPNQKYYAWITPTCELKIMKVRTTSSKEQQQQQQQQYSYYEDEDEDEEDQEVWSSDSYIPAASSHGGCVLELEGPHLVLRLGSNTPTSSQTGSIVWYSEVSPPFEFVNFLQGNKQKEKKPPKEVSYLARLDNDGSFVVYEQRPFDEEDNHSENDQNNNNPHSRRSSSTFSETTTFPKRVNHFFAKHHEDVQQWWVDNRQHVPWITKTLEKTSTSRQKIRDWYRTNVVQKTVQSRRHMKQWYRNFQEKTSTPRTNASKAWVKTRTWIKRTILHKKKQYEQTRYDSFQKQKQHDDDNDETKNNKNRSSVLKETCIYATGPAGCITPVRKVVHAATDIRETLEIKVRDTVIKADKVLDQAVDHIVDWIGEEEDDDFVDVIIRMTTKAGNQAFRVGKIVGTKSFRFVRQTIDSFIDSDADEDLWG